MAITNIRQQVIQDFRDKLILEPKLGKKLRALNRDIVTKFRLDTLRGEMTRADIFQPELQEILAEHYDIVAAKFEGRIADDMPEETALTDEEKATLAAAMLAFMSARAIRQSRIITDNTQGDMRAATQIVNEETPDQIERAVSAAAILAVRLRKRETGIASLETQAMAEATKGAEFDVLAGKTPFSLERPSEPVNKEWVTVGDERVRQAHVIADAQVKPIDQPFSVKGQMLRWPGDSALGATIDNLINCRCSSVYDTGAVFAMRVRPGRPTVVETVPSEQLLVSLGE